MPITQDRMMAVIAAAKDLRQCFNALNTEMDAIALHALQGTITLEQISERIITVQLQARPNLALAETLAEEGAHFRAMQHHNNQNRRRLERFRRRQRGEAESDEESAAYREFNAALPEDLTRRERGAAYVRSQAEAAQAEKAPNMPRPAAQSTPPPRRKPRAPSTATHTDEDQTTIELGEAPDLAGDDSDGGFAL